MKGQQENEPDEPNVGAIYVIIVVCILTVVGTIWGLAEYKGHLDKKLRDQVERVAFEQRNKTVESEAKNQAIVEQKLKSAKKGDFNGL
ncbi:MAG: hypothetical protein MK132_12015 [Lentisphaerales bacterium]|nr:hypothetical protein [Lentisphaerales bacterium]